MPPVSCSGADVQGDEQPFLSERSPPWFPQPGFPRGCWAVAHPSLVSLAAEKVSSLGKDWHKFCLKCERCNKTLTPGGHAEVRAARAGRVGAVQGCRGARWDGKPKNRAGADI